MGKVNRSSDIDLEVIELLNKWIPLSTQSTYGNPGSNLSQYVINQERRERQLYTPLKKIIQKTP